MLQRIGCLKAFAEVRVGLELFENRVSTLGVAPVENATSEGREADAQEEAQIDAFVLGVLGEKRGAAALRREKLKPKNEGLQGKTPEAGCVVM